MERANFLSYHAVSANKFYYYQHRKICDIILSCLFHTRFCKPFGDRGGHQSAVGRVIREEHMLKTSRKISWEIIKKTFLPLILLLLSIGAYLAYKIKVAPTISPELTHALKKYIGTIFVLCIAFMLQRFAGGLLGWYKENVAAKTKSRLDDKLIPLFRRTVKVIIWVLAFLVILPFYGVNINALIAALGVGSLAIALAAQDTIANVIAGFLIMVDAPFREGDKIKLPSGENAIALEIGVRRSKFLAEDKAIIIVPNLDLSKSKIVNYTYGEEKLEKSHM